MLVWQMQAFCSKAFCTLIEKFKSEFDLGRLTAQLNTTLHQAWCEYEHAVLKNMQDSIFPSAFSATTAFCLHTQQRHYI